MSPDAGTLPGLIDTLPALCYEYQLLSIDITFLRGQPPRPAAWSEHGWT